MKLETYLVRPTFDDRVERRSGFSLLEVVVVAGIMTLVVGGLTMAIFRTEIGFAEQMQLANIRSIGRQVSERLSTALRQADPATILPSVLDNDATLQFQQVVGVENSVPILGDVVVISLTPADGETLNGSDDNGDGRVDESFLTINEGGETLLLSGNLLGLRFQSTTNGISFSFDVGVVNREGLVEQSTFTHEVSFRN